MFRHDRPGVQGLSSNESCVATASGETVSVWSRSGRRYFSNSVHDERVHSVHILSERSVFSASDNYCYVWSPTGSPALLTQTKTSAAAMSGGTLVAGDYNGNVWLWTPGYEDHRFKSVRGIVNSVAVHDNLVAAGSSLGDVAVYNKSQKEPVMTLENRGMLVSSVTIDGNALVFGGHDMSVLRRHCQVYDVRTRELLHVLDHDAPVTTVWARAGVVFTAAHDGVRSFGNPRFWPLPGARCADDTYCGGESDTLRYMS